MPINKYVIEITDSKKAEYLDDKMNFYGQMDDYSEMDDYRRIKRESYTTSWRKGKGNHEWEEKTYSLADLEKIKIKLHLSTPHEKDSEGVERPVRDKKTLDIIITKKRGGALGIQEIKNTIDKIEAETGIRKIERPNE